MKKIYGITQGEYSDYRVLALCMDEETANLWAKEVGGELEEFLLIELGTTPYKVTEWYQVIELWDNGEILDRGLTSRTESVIDTLYGPPPVRPYSRYVRAPYHNNSGGRLEVRGSTAKSVAKVVGEKIAMWKVGAYGGPGHDEIIEGKRS